MKVFITGGTGYIGSEIVNELIARGHEVKALARNNESATKLKAKGIEVVLGDLSDYNLLTNETKNVDASIHTAFAMDPSNPLKAIEVDKKSTEALISGLSISTKPSVLIYTSGGPVAGVGNLPLNESSNEQPANALAWRREHEQIVLHSENDNLRPIVIRPPIIYGNQQSGLINFIIGISKQQNSGIVIGNENALWSTIHVKDLAKFYVDAMENNSSKGIYHATSSEKITLKEIAIAISNREDLEGIKTLSVNDASQFIGPFAEVLSQGNVLVSERTSLLNNREINQTGIIESLENK